jgi:hypothetical protein
MEMLAAQRWTNPRQLSNFTAGTSEFDLFSLKMMALFVKLQGKPPKMTPTPPMNTVIP